MKNKQHSLKNEILLRLAVPLIFFISFESLLSYFVTLHHVDTAYDRWLLDSARSLSQEVKAREGEIFAELPPAALEIFKWDESDKTYFKIITENDDMIAGDKYVPEPFDSGTDWSKPVYYNDEMYGEPVRVVSMLIAPKDASDKVFVFVAETMNKRRGMMTDILLADLVPQMVLVLLAGIYLVVGVKRGLKPLNALADEIAKRSPSDLRPIPEQHVFLEVRALTDTINDLLARLGAAIATRQRFIANAAHQLRTPLAGLKLQVERALREKEMAKMRPALIQIRGSADRMSHLTAQLLMLAKSEPIDGGYELQPVDLAKLAKEVCMDWAPKALQRRMELGFEGTDQAVTVQGDEILNCLLVVPVHIGNDTVLDPVADVVLEGLAHQGEFAGWVLVPEMAVAEDQAVVAIPQQDTQGNVLDGSQELALDGRSIGLGPASRQRRNANQQRPSRVPTRAPGISSSSQVS
ncbi:MAG: sensor histidine kinase N-terminal domain-containing protein [Gammaproteobacteria bacterium]